MIPKKIHYCWFGGAELPKLAKKCIKSWKKYLPDYEIIRWDESNFDINCCDYVREAYEAKKWAFVSDFARLKILYENGGIYFDTDVEVIKSFDDIVADGSFLGIELENSDIGKLYVNPGLGMGMAKNIDILDEIIKYYEKIHFANEDGTYNQTTIGEHITEILKKRGLSIGEGVRKIAGLNIYPQEYFCPLNYDSKTTYFTDNTHSIHHFMDSWHSKREKNKQKRKVRQNQINDLKHYILHFPNLILQIVLGKKRYGDLKAKLKKISKG